MLSCLEKISFCSVLLCIYSVAYPSAGPDTNPIRSSAIQVAQFEKQLKHGDIKVNELNPAGLTPLQEAICESNVDIVSLLCDYEKTDINAYSSKGFTALHYAIEKSDCKCTGCHTCDSCKIINSLFRRKSLTVDQPKRYCYRISTYLPFHTTPYDEGMTALHIAASKGDLKNAKLLIEHNANVNALTCWGRSPLHYAAYRSDKQGKYAETIELLYTSHALIDQEDHFKETPLIAAIKSPAIRKDDNSLDNNITSIEKLLERGANINHISGRKTNKTPLIAAVQKNDLTLVEWLVNRGAQVNVKNIYGCTALDIAIAENYEEIQRFLIAKGAHYTFGKRYLASLEPKPACILYPLHEAADAGNLDRLQAILSQTAGSCVAVNGVDDYMRTPLHYAACADRNEIIVYLLAQSGRMYSCDIEGKTPLELAIENGKIKSVKCFLDQPGIEEYLKSEHTEAITIGTHLLTIAASKKREDIVLELYNHKAILPDKPLSWAVQNNLENLTQKILATPEMQVNSEQTKTAKIEALKIAVEQLNTKMIKILIEAGTSIEETQQYLALLKNSASDPKKKILLEIIENIFVNLTDIETIVTQHQDFNEYDEKEGLICLQDSELKELGIHGTIRASLQQTRSDADYHRNYSGYYAIFNALNPLEIHNADKRRHFTSFFRASLTYLKQIGINPPYDNLTAQQLDLLLTEIKKNPGGFGIKDTNVLDKVIILPTEQLYSFLNAEVKLEKPYAAKVLNVFNTFAITQVDLLSIIISNNSSPKNWYSITAYKEGSDTSINIYHPALRLQKWQQRLLYNICATDLIYYFVMLTQPIQKWKNLLNQAFKTEIDRVCFSCKELPNFKAKPVIDILNNFTECLLRINNSIGLIRSEFAEVDSTSTQCIVHALRLGLFAQEYDLLFKKLFHYFCETKQKGSTDTKIITFIRNHALCVEQLKENFNLIAFDKTMSCGKKNQLGAEMLETIDKIIVDINTLKNEISTNPHSLTSGKFYDAAPGEIPAEKFKLIEKFIPIQLKEIVQSQASAVTGKRLIFYGEPGNGKTTIAQAFAQLCLFVDTDGTRKPRPFHMVRVPALGTKYRFSKQNQLSELKFGHK